MNLSVWSSYYVELTPEDAVKRFINNGIYCSELSDEHGLMLLNRGEDAVETGKTFSAFLKENNFEMPQGHLYLRVKICSDEKAIEALYRWIDLYEAIGIKNMVLHCDNMIDTDLDKEQRTMKNIEALRVLAEYIKDKDITVCLENLRPHTPTQSEIVDRNADDLLYIIDRIGSDRFGICLDTGHLNLTDKNQREFIFKAGKKLKALHIANNEGETDQHMMPFSRGNVDFIDVMKALKEIGYKGLFNLEIPGERRAPLEVLDLKLHYIKEVYDYLDKVTE
ncbi:MAG: sugar phosphate isomerase/epimerase [Ruminococcaceae bacterium]|nr:sugar phosphate isomerase/epimerase [Oscillospiraceae bacterium]